MASKEHKMHDVRFADEVTYISNEAEWQGSTRRYRRPLLFLKGLGLASLLYLLSYAITPSGFRRLPGKHTQEKLVDFDDVCHLSLSEDPMTDFCSDYSQ